MYGIWCLKMTEYITLEISEAAARRARDLAQRTGRSLNDVLSDWIDHSAADVPIETLSDSEVLALSEAMLNDSDQDELDRLLAAQREEQITVDERGRLDQLMAVYRRGLVRKAQALRVAVLRGLRPVFSTQL